MAPLSAPFLVTIGRSLARHSRLPLIFVTSAACASELAGEESPWQAGDRRAPASPRQQSRGGNGWRSAPSRLRERRVRGRMPGASAGGQSRRTRRRTSWAAAAHRGRASRSRGRARPAPRRASPPRRRRRRPAARGGAPARRRDPPCRRSRARSPRRRPRQSRGRFPPTAFRARPRSGSSSASTGTSQARTRAQRDARPYFTRLASIGAIERDSVVTTLKRWAISDAR